MSYTLINFENLHLLAFITFAGSISLCADFTFVEKFEAKRKRLSFSPQTPPQQYSLHVGYRSMC